MAARSRKKVGTEKITVPVTEVRILVSFNGMVAGDVGFVGDDDPVVQGWISAGLAEVVRVHPVEGELVLEVSDDGEDPAGPGEPEPDVQGAGEA